MCKWSFAYKKARKSDYEQCVLDRYRFENRIKYAEKYLTKVLEKSHRQEIYQNLFKKENISFDMKSKENPILEKMT